MNPTQTRLDRHRTHGLRDGTAAREGRLRSFGLEPHARQGRTAQGVRREGRRQVHRPRRLRHRIHDGIDRQGRQRSPLRQGGRHVGRQDAEIVVDSTSISIPESSEIRRRVTKRGVKLLAAPVSGNAKVIKAGKLTVVCSGPQDAYDTVLPYLSNIGSGVSYCWGRRALAHRQDLPQPDVGRGHPEPLRDHAARAEGRHGRHAFLDFLNKSVMGSMFTRYKTPALVNLDFAVTFTPELLRKDLDLGLSAAKELGVPMPLTSITRDLVQTLIGNGYTDQDFATLLLLAAKALGMELTAENVKVGDGLTG